MSDANYSESNRYFYELATKPDLSVPLAESALWIARDEYPELDIPYYLNQLEQIAGKIRHNSGRSNKPLELISEMNNYLFDELGYQGNREDYYDPKNSFLNDVMDRKLGIPITLSVIYMELGKQLNLEIVGIGFPGHFLVKYIHPSDEIIIDPYYKGAILTMEDCQSRLDELYQGRLILQKRFLHPVSNREILFRMLNNLKAIFINQKEYQKALEVINKILILYPDNSDEIRDRGKILFQINRESDALADFKYYLKSEPFAEDKPEIEQYIRHILSRIAQRN